MTLLRVCKHTQCDLLTVDSSSQSSGLPSCGLRQALPCSGEDQLIKQLFVKGLVAQLACKVIWVCVSAGQLATGGEISGVCVRVCVLGRQSVCTVFPGRQAAIRGSFIKVTAPVKLNTPSSLDCHGNAEKWMPLWALMSTVTWAGRRGKCVRKRERKRGCLWGHSWAYSQVKSGVWASYFTKRVIIAFKSLNLGPILTYFVWKVFEFRCKTGNIRYDIILKGNLDRQRMSAKAACCCHWQDKIVILLVQQHSG